MKKNTKHKPLIDLSEKQSVNMIDRKIHNHTKSYSHKPEQSRRLSQRYSFSFSVKDDSHLTVYLKAVPFPLILCLRHMKGDCRAFLTLEKDLN